MDPLLTPQPAATATALDASFYVDPAMAARDRALVFDRAWQLIAHISRLQNPGDHVIADFAGLPVIAVRGADGQVRVFHNVCRHRAGPIAQCDGLAAKSLRCRYHGWTYTLDGVLRSAPEMGGAEDFNPADIRLPQLTVREWQGIVFACVDEAFAPPFDAFVDGIAARLAAAFPVEATKPVGAAMAANAPVGAASAAIPTFGHHKHITYEIACNWKVYVDNYLEGYHVPHIHPGLNRLLDYRSYVTETAEWYSYQWSPLEGGDTYGNGDALYYWLWPNTMLNILPGRLQTNRVVPMGVDKCRVEFDFYYAQDESGEARARRDADLEFSDEVQHEDLQICEDVQRGLASGSYAAGRLNPLRENAVHHFHELLRRVYREEEAGS